MSIVMPDAEDRDRPEQPERLPGLPIFEVVRRYCRVEVANLRERFPQLIERIKEQYPSLSPLKIIQALDAYLEIDPREVPGGVQHPEAGAIRNEREGANMTRSAPSTSSTNESDDALIGKYYQDGDDQAFETLFRKKVGLKAGIKRRYPALDEDAVYDDAFLKIANTRQNKSGRYKPRADASFDAWLWMIIRRCAASELTRRTPAVVLVTPFGSDWKISLDEESTVLHTLREMEAEIREIQKQKNRKRWKWAFDVALYEAAGKGHYLQFKVYSNVRVGIEILGGRILLLFPVSIDFETGSGTLPLAGAAEMRDSLMCPVQNLHASINALREEHQATIFLCDLLQVPLADAVAILHTGQDGPNPQPPYVRVGQWRSTAKEKLAEKLEEKLKEIRVEAISMSPEAIDEMLKYASCAYYDPNLDDGEGRSVGGSL
jgi:DNA-directed RNA polymerase specialized sigma24 family protein